MWYDHPTRVTSPLDSSVAFPPPDHLALLRPFNKDVDWLRLIDNAAGDAVWILRHDYLIREWIGLPLPQLHTASSAHETVLAEEKVRLQKEGDRDIERFNASQRDGRSRAPYSIGNTKSQGASRKIFSTNRADSSLELTSKPESRPTGPGARNKSQQQPPEVDASPRPSVPQPSVATLKRPRRSSDNDLELNVALHPKRPRNKERQKPAGKLPQPEDTVDSAVQVQQPDKKSKLAFKWAQCPTSLLTMWLLPGALGMPEKWSLKHEKTDSFNDIMNHLYAAELKQFGFTNGFERWRPQKQYLEFLREDKTNAKLKAIMAPPKDQEEMERREAEKARIREAAQALGISLAPGW